MYLVVYFYGSVPSMINLIQLLGTKWWQYWYRVKHLMDVMIHQTKLV